MWSGIFGCDTLAILVVYNVICSAGMDVLKFPITPKMVSSVRSASAAYKASLAAKQQQQTEEQQKPREDIKCKALINSLDQQKKLKMDELKSQATELDRQLAELKSAM